MLKRVLVSILCLITLCAFMLTCLAEEALELMDVADVKKVTVFTDGTEKAALPRDHIQYFVKWDESKAPEDFSMTEEEYLAILEKDKNENGILDSLEEEDEDVVAASIETGVLGDLNGDELVDNRDVILLYRHIAGWNQDINSDILDFNGDGYTNNSDANYLLKYVSGWPDIVLYKGKKNDIVYHLYSEGMYVPETGITNSNPDYYYSSEGLSLKNIQADGYIFEGWYDGEGASATRIRKIDVGETGEIELYARWTPRPYKIDFDSDLVSVDSKYYTIETGATLTNPSLANYTFVGWTNQEDGRLVRGIPKGTFGNLILSANWASRRNQTKPVQNLEDPIILEDSGNGKILFIYRIGDIENVPLFTLYRFSTAEGIATSVTLTRQTSISMSDAQTISHTVANATTDSATWTLSEGWNNSTSVNEEWAKQSGKTLEEAETIAKSSTGTYRLDSSQGGSDVVTNSEQYTFKAGGEKGHSSSETDENGGKTELSVDAGGKMGFSGDLGPGAKVNAEVHVDVGASHEWNDNHTETSTDSWKNTIEGSSQTSNGTTNTKNWNTTSSFSNSNTMSDSTTTSQLISELITSRYGYGQSYSHNGNQSSGQAFTTETSQQDSYSNTVTYNESKLISEVITWETNGTDGYYRQVLAGTAHVFAIVGYDVATSSYFVYTFTIMDDETYQFLDYSKTTPSFNDNEIGVIPFEIPFFVNEYVNSRIAHSTGLEININTGTVTGYDGNDPVVVVPSYVDVDNGDGTYSSVKITGVASEAFKGNKTLQGIMLSEFISEIPDSAFEGCTSLRDVYIPGLTSIGNRAFYGCISLSKLTIPTDVVSLGTNALYDVNEVEITAANKNVALAAVNSGAKSLVLNIASIEEAMDNTEFEVPLSMDAFELQGGRKNYKNLRVKSYASKTGINGVNFVDCIQVPLELHSSNVNLNQTTVSGSGYCMIIANDNCKLNLFGINKMNSSGGNAIVCANTTLANTDGSVQAQLQVTGNVYVCGSITNQDRYLSVSNGEIILISQEVYEQYVNGVYQLKFNANGGSVQEQERIAYSGASIGTLPTATRTGYTFDGWYTAASGGTQVTASSTFISSSSVTVYAHWSAIPCTVSFNGNGGTASTTSKSVSYDSTYGNLATASRTGYTFAGWYTAASGGTKIESTTKVTTTSNHTLYAHWTANTYTVTFDGNGGSAGTSSKSVTYDSTYGSLATATRTCYTFAGWYTASSGGTKVESTTKVTTTSNHTLYAHWTENPWSNWVEASELPSGDILTESKTQYRYQDANYSGWSGWSGWDENRQSTSELKEEESATVWYWYRYVCPNCGAHMHVYNKCYTWAGGCGSTIGSTNYQVCWLTTPPGSGTQDWEGTGRIMLGSGTRDRWFYWVDSSQGYPNGKSTTGYRYRTRTKSWGSWSGWSDNAVSGSTTRNVQTRTVYRYKMK